MKKLFAVLGVLVLVGVGWTQDEGRPTVFTNRISIQLDSTETEKVYLGFLGPLRSGATVGFTSSAITPVPIVQWTGDLEINFRIDSSAVSTEYDSLAGYVLELNDEGYAKGDTFYFDWENNTVSSDSTIEYTNWVPFNRDTTSALPIFSINLTGKLAPSHAIEIGFIQAAADSIGTAQAMISTVELRSEEVK